MRAHASKTSGPILYVLLKQHSTTASAGRSSASRVGGVAIGRLRSLTW
jgi:hypothetical protein